jgi:hypothetical protein
MNTPAISFQRLSQTTTIYEPPKDAVAAPDAHAPTTIVLFGWMGANSRNLRRYSAKYNSVFPAARIILVTSALTDTPGFKVLLSPAQLRGRSDIPARALLAGDTERLLVHAFSNGGGMALAAVSKAYRDIGGTALPARAVIFDSLPGGDKFSNEFGRWVKAIAVGLPSNPFLRWPGQVLIALVVIVLLGLPSLFGLENAATKARRELNDEELINEGAKRLFLYSEADALIGAKEVREYAAESAEKGWDVKTVDFGDSGHVRHCIDHPEKYWDAVLSTWKSSV